ncbi:MAG: RNA pseudouridine synthase [Bacteroidales bacterium]|jgi:23S rRNA pseudouridine1911/1915/1917 synthase|nr:RNA pseudouridine synthase [Bacteroidales bacterium]
MNSLPVLYEDNHLVIVNKSAGEIVQGDSTGDVPLLEKVRQYLKEKYHKQGAVFCGLVHRLDRPVSGAVIFAKTSKALSRMNDLIREHGMTKIYHAIVENDLPQEKGTLVDYMKKNENQNKSYLSPVPKEGYKRAELYYETAGHSRNYTLVEIRLVTGRHHQIRAQLSHAGAPIKGDLKYGARRSNPDGSIALHACKIVFEHPVSHQQVLIEHVPAPEAFEKIWKESIS